MFFANIALCLWSFLLLLLVIRGPSKAMFPGCSMPTRLRGNCIFCLQARFTKDLTKPTGWGHPYTEEERSRSLPHSAPTLWNAPDPDLLVLLEAPFCWKVEDFRAFMESSGFL